MSDLRVRLERETQGLPISTDGLERTLTRVRRRNRNRRLVAGSVALALVGASAVLLVRTWRSTPPVPADQPPRPVPAASGSLAYALDGDIFVAGSDGSNAIRVADGRPPDECGVRDGFSTGEYWAEGSIWSPDGRYLAYRRANCDVPGDFRWRVVISDPEGDVIAEFPGEGWSISWSPDSTRVAVWVGLFETIGVFGVDGERKALLTVPSAMLSSGDHDPMWSPNGDSLLVSEVVVPLDGSAPSHLASAARDLALGTYSPEGSRVAYPTRKALVVAEADGANPQEVFGGWTWSPVWSPSGDQIAFASTSGRRFPNQLRVLDVATGAVTLLANVDGSDSLEVIDFSPEGDRILFQRTEGDVSSLWSINADGSDRRRLVAGIQIDQGGDWLSPGPTS